MRLINFRISGIITGLALFTGFVTSPAIAQTDFNPNQIDSNSETNVVEAVTAPPPTSIRGNIPGGKDTDGQTLYVCVIDLPDNTAQPGKATPNKGKWGCNSGRNGREYRVENYNNGEANQLPYFSYLGAPDSQWIYLPPNQRPSAFSAFLPSQTDSNGTTLYYCNAQYGNSIQLGRALQTNGVWGCNFGYGGQERREDKNFKYLWIYR